jgi:cytochrome c556
MKKALWAGVALAVIGVSAATAGVIDDRQTIMKGFNNASRTLGGMARGTTPFDAAAAAAQLQVLSDGGAKLTSLFPAGSDKDTDTAKTLALPTVWSDTPGFLAAAAKFNADVKTAQATTDAAGFTAAFMAVNGDCGGCHKTYRAQPPRPAAPPPAQ